MFKITPEHLFTLFNIIERDGLENISEFLNNSPDNPYHSLDDFPLGEAGLILKNYFQAQQNAFSQPLPPDMQLKVNKTIIFSTKLCLLMNIDIEQYSALFKSHLTALTNIAQEIFSYNSLEAKLFFINKISFFRKKPSIIQDPQLKAILDNTIQNLAIGSHSTLTYSLIKKDDVLLSYVRFLKNTADLPNLNAWVTSFVLHTRKLYEAQTTYNDRNDTLKYIAQSWELIKDNLLPDDINWLIEQINRIQQTFKNINSPSHHVTNDIRNFFRFLIENRTFALAINSSIVVPVLMFNLVCYLLQTNYIRIIKLQSQHLKKSDSEIQNTPPYLRKIEDQIYKGIASKFNLADENLPAALNNAENLLLVLYFISFLQAVALTGGNYVVYRYSHFFQQRQLTPPIALPDWCRERLEKKSFLSSRLKTWGEI